MLDGDGGGPAGERIGDLDAGGMRGEAFEEGGEAVPQIGKRAGAGWILRAGVEEQIQGALRVAGEVERHAQGKRRHPIEDRGADVLTVLAQVDERGASPVGAAPQIDRLVPERGADVVEILHGDRRGVAAHVGLVRAQAGEDPVLAESLGAEEILQRRVLGGELAFERARGAGAALIDEHHVARAPDTLEGGDDAPEHLGCGLAGPAGEEEERVRSRRARQRGNERDAEIDRSTAGIRAVFGNAENAALGGKGDAPQPAGRKRDLPCGLRVRAPCSGSCARRSQGHGEE